MDDIRFTISSSAVLVPAAGLWCVMVAFLMVNRKRRLSAGNAFLLLTVGAYTVAVLALTIFPIDAVIGRYASITPWYHRFNWIPLLTIDVKTFVLNVVMTVPLGMMLPLLVARVRSVRTVALIAAVTSGCIEVVQFALDVGLDAGRTADVNDLIANTLGAVLGFWAISAAAHTSPLAGVLETLALPNTAWAPVGQPTVMVRARGSRR
jgi:glycopeptide antibiotics resistance protein